MNTTLLIIGHTFPEPTTTAAGVRMLQLISLFQESGYKITFASTASISEKSTNLTSLGVISKQIHLNDPSFDFFLTELFPSIVLFDRFITEEQFGWRVAEACPNAMRILDTEDLHFLRKARQKAFNENKEISTPHLFTETAKREIASILRCDMTLLISTYEKELLESTFSISSSLLYYLPFMVSKIPNPAHLVSFEERTGFVTIGNLLHAPNVDSVLYLKKEIWPGIRKALPKAVLSVYGNYATQQIQQLHDEKNGFLIKGWTPSVKDVMQNARICLAPLRFGAGLKGKLIDAMLYGTPAVTTQIGAEGMYGSYRNAGAIADTTELFIAHSIALYIQKENWKIVQERGFKVLKNRFIASAFSSQFLKRIEQIYIRLVTHRNENFIGQVLLHNSLQATRYMSKWIEEKNKNKKLN